MKLIDRKTVKIFSLIYNYLSFIENSLLIGYSEKYNFHKKQKQPPELFCQKVVIRNFIKFTGKHLGQSLFFKQSCRPQACNFIKKETLAKVFSCEFCEIFNNTFFHRTLMVAASGKTSLNHL